MLNDLHENLTKKIENTKLELQNIKNTQSEMKNTWSEMKKTLQGIKNGQDEAVDQIKDLEDKEAENKHPIKKTKRKNIPQNKDSMRSLLGDFKSMNICIMKVPEEKEREQKIENMWKIMTENFT